MTRDTQPPPTAEPRGQPGNGPDGPCRAFANDPEASRFAIGELADQAGVSRRAVRFYVQRGLLPSPEGGGRGSFYTADHLATLLTLKRLQEEGVSLTAIAQRLGLAGTASQDLDAARASEAPDMSARPVGRWLRVEVADGLELQVREDQLHRFPPAKLAHALAAALEHLTDSTPNPRQDGE